jgi:Cu/Ag efflux protein CusF
MRKLATLTILLGLASGVAAPALAQGAAMLETGKGGAAEGDTVEVRAKVTAVDPAARKVTLALPDGSTTTVVVSADVPNFQNITVGSTVVARYYESAAFAISRGGAATPQNSASAVVATGTSGNMPAGVVGERITLTGLVVAVDKRADTLSVVNPKGGEVLSFNVKDPALLTLMDQLKPGDSITATISQAVAVSVVPAGN